MPNVAPASVMSPEPSVIGFGVASPLRVIGSADVPGWALLVHEFGVVTVSALAGVATSNTGTIAASRPSSARMALFRRRVGDRKVMTPLVSVARAVVQ